MLEYSPLTMLRYFRWTAKCTKQFSKNNVLKIHNDKFYKNIKHEKNMIAYWNEK